MTIRMIRTLLSILLFVLLFWPSQAFSEVYQPSAPVFVKTQVLKISDEKDAPDMKIWRVVAEVSDQSGEKELSIYSQNAQKPICRITFSYTGQIAKTDIAGAQGNILQKDDFLAVPGYPAPCDILPQALITSNASEASASFQIQRDISGQKFMDEICINSFPISIHAAGTKGWLKGAARDYSGMLRVVKAVNCRSGKLVSLQVWPVGGSWWFYEQTPYRKSWQIASPGE